MSRISEPLGNDNNQVNDSVTKEPTPTQNNSGEYGKTNLKAKTEVKKSKNLFLFFGAAVLFAFVCYGFLQSHKDKSEQAAKQDEQQVMTSSRTLTLPPRAEIEAVKPDPVVREVEKPPVQPTQVAVQAVPPAALQVQPRINPVNEKREPTLEERRYAAPLMGDSSTIAEEGAGGSGGRPKGFAESLREEGYKSGVDSTRLGGLMTSVSTPPGRASMMPNRNLLLAKGTFIDCVLETRLDTTVPGMTSCVIPRDVYSANGKVLLIERGSKVVGEYQGSVANGLARIFVLWTQIQTPNGVRVNLDSPGTDALGGAGLSGYVDYHWWARFGNALLFTLVQDAFQFGMNKQSENNGGVNYYGNTEDGMNQIIQEAMRQSGNIPPTLTKNQGERIGIFVARDVDFANVYKLVPVKKEVVTVSVEKPAPLNQAAGKKQKQKR